MKTHHDIALTISSRTAALGLATALALALGCGNNQQSGKPAPGASAGKKAPVAAKNPTPTAEPTPTTAVDEGNAPEAADSDFDPRVTKAAELAAAIDADPSKADQVLADADLDRDGLDALMREIATDPDLSAQYRIARGLEQQAQD